MSPIKCTWIISRSLITSVVFCSFSSVGERRKCAQSTGQIDCWLNGQLLACIYFVRRQLSGHLESLSPNLFPPARHSILLASAAGVYTRLLRRSIFWDQHFAAPLNVRRLPAKVIYTRHVMASSSDIVRHKSSIEGGFLRRRRCAVGMNTFRLVRWLARIIRRHAPKTEPRTNRRRLPRNKPQANCCWPVCSRTNILPTV